MDMSFPGSGGSITVDEVRLFNGTGERYQWKIVGKREMYIPYNAYRLHSPNVKYADLLKTGHVNPEHMRYELHRVWVLEGTLKEGFRHLYGKRVMYIDEDTHLMMGENYDARGGLLAHRHGELLLRLRSQHLASWRGAVLRPANGLLPGVQPGQ